MLAPVVRDLETKLSAAYLCIGQKSKAYGSDQYRSHNI